MIVRNIPLSLFGAAFMIGVAVAADTNPNLFTNSPAEKIVLIGPNRPDDLQQYAASELVRHIEKITEVKPRLLKVADIRAAKLPTDSNVIMLGRTVDNPLLKGLSEGG
ncbi:MAG: hypothetical protein QGH33_15395, partial [Pirellulaceae bacterium]|nr:hypothetical protein [Pirellulaceae bacterium]